MTDPARDRAIVIAREMGIDPAAPMTPEQTAELRRRWHVIDRAAGTGMPFITEHATQMSGGGFHVWNEASYITDRWPTAEKIGLEHRNGQTVWQRKVIVIEDWTEVPRA